MATTLALAMRASMSAGGVVSGANQAAGAMAKMGKAAAKTASDVNVLKNIAIGGALLKSVNAMSSALRRATNAALGFAGSISQTVDDTAKLARRLSVSVESLQSLQLAAKMSGIKDLTPILQKMAITLGQAASGAEPAVKAFEAIGLSSKELASLSADEQFEAIAAKLSAIQDPAARAAAAVKIFGEQGVTLLPLLGQNLEETRERMERLGIVLSGDQTEAIEGMNDALTMVQATFQGIIGQVLGNLAPVVESLANEILSMVESFNSVSGEGGTGIANAITEAMFDVLEFLAGVFDSAAVNFSSFGGIMSTVGDIFQRVGNIFVGVAETFRAIWNSAQIAMNELFAKLGRGLEAAGEFLGSDDLQNFGQFWAEDLERQNQENNKELLDAATNAGKAFSRAWTGESDQPGAAGPLQSAVQGLRGNFRNSQTPEAKAAREAERKAKQDAERAAREAAAKALADQKAAAELKKQQEDAAKKAAAVQEKIDAKAGDISEIDGERRKALGEKSNEALQANDVRSSEGMSQFLALATGREDPAIAEYRKQTQKLEELKAELRALQQEKVEILGGANN